MGSENQRPMYKMRRKVIRLFLVEESLFNMKFDVKQECNRVMKMGSKELPFRKYSDLKI